MKKIMLQQYMGVLATLATLILSVTLYAYSSDQTNTNEKIDTEIKDREKADLQLKKDIEKVEERSEKDREKIKADYLREIERMNNLQDEMRKDIKTLLSR